MEAHQSVSPCETSHCLPKARGTSPLSPATTLAKPPHVRLSSNAYTETCCHRCSDSNPAVAGGGIERLRAAGIQVDVGCLEAELAWQNRRFLWNAETKRPWVVLKWAESRDGYMDGRPLQERQPGAGGFPITAETARPLTHTWRALEQGIVVGANTALVDMPQLNVRRIEAPSPRIVLLDPDGLINMEHALIQRNSNLVYVVGPTKSPATKHNCHWEVKDGLDALLEQLYAEFNLSSLLVEGGATVLNDFLKQDAWNEIKCWRSPATGGGLPAVHSRPFPPSHMAWRLRDSWVLIMDQSAPFASRIGLTETLPSPGDLPAHQHRIIHRNFRPVSTLPTLGGPHAPSHRAQLRRRSGVGLGTVRRIGLLRAFNRSHGYGLPWAWACSSFTYFN